MTVFALVDCNNFYVSCERVFNPRLEGKPVLVLSNNDGCAVARSNEVKKLGIRMGAPVFKQKDLIEKHGIQVFSSNYALYGDMSRRVVTVLSEFCRDLEVYSIDECFLDLSDVPPDRLVDFGRMIRETVKKCTGIPVSVGIARTKALAKIAARIAKKSTKAAGVLDLTAERYHDAALEMTEVADVWGVGRRYAKFLMVYGISNARMLRDADREFIRKKMGINGVRLMDELKGRSCYPLDRNPSPQKGVTVSRSFGRPVRDLAELREAVASFASRSAEKLRKNNQTADLVTVVVMTDRFKVESFYYNTCTVRLPVSTNHTPEIIHAALDGLARIHREGSLYKKAGVYLAGLSQASMVQTVMFDTVDRERAGRLMTVLDTVNETMGKETLHYAATGLSPARTWHTVFSRRSPGWTTRWDQLPEVR
jgi:DNA polymerase V